MYLSQIDEMRCLSSEDRIDRFSLVQYSGTILLAGGIRIYSAFQPEDAADGVPHDKFLTNSQYLLIVSSLLALQAH